jgi:hypothetical protein
LSFKYFMLETASNQLTKKSCKAVVTARIMVVKMP